jgi:hypothetical protein
LNPLFLYILCDVMISIRFDFIVTKCSSSAPLTIHSWHQRQYQEEKDAYSTAEVCLAFYFEKAAAQYEDLYHAHWQHSRWFSLEIQSDK